MRYNVHVKPLPSSDEHSPDRSAAAADERDPSPCAVLVESNPDSESEQTMAGQAAKVNNASSKTKLWTYVPP